MSNLEKIQKGMRVFEILSKIVLVCVRDNGNDMFLCYGV